MYFVFQPLMVVCNKTDVIKVEDLPADKKELLKVFDENKNPLMSMSTLTEEGVAEVKEQVNTLFLNQAILVVIYFIP